MRPDFRYDSRYTSKYKQNIQETIEFVLEQDYGTVIPLEKLGDLLGYNIEDEVEKRKMKSQFTRVKNFCIDYGYIFKSLGSTGYYILKPQQIPGHCYHTYVLKTQRLLDKSGRILKHIDTTKLSKDRLEEKDQMQELNTTLIDNIDNIIHESKYMERKEYYDNLEDWK